MSGSQESHAVRALRAAARRSAPGGARVLEEAAQTLARLLETGLHTKPDAAPALSRLHAAAVAHADARLLRGPFSFAHEGCRYRGHRFKNGSTEARTWSGHVLTLGLKDTPDKDFPHD